MWGDLRVRMSMFWRARWDVLVGNSLRPSRQLWSVEHHIVQSYGRDVGRESTTISEHSSVADAFAEIDRLAAEMLRTGARPETVTLLVVDAMGIVVRRPGVQ